MKSKKKSNKSRSKNKVIFSVSIDQEVYDLLSDYYLNRSMLINSLLRRHLGLATKITAPSSFYEPKNIRN